MKHKLVLYQKVYIVDNIYNNETVYQSWMPCSVIVGGIVSTLLFYQVLRPGSIKFTMLFYFLLLIAIECIIVPSIIFYVSASIFKNCSRGLTRLTKECVHEKSAWKKLKGLPPFSIKLGFFKAIKFNLVFSFYVWVTKSVLFLLLAFPD